MIIKLHMTPSTQFAIAYELVEYDAAPPVRELLMDRAPKTRHNDRDALAGYLAFGEWIGTALTLPGKLSPATAQAIQRDSSVTALAVEPIEYYPKALPISTERVQLRESIQDSFASDMELSLMRSDRWNGAIAHTSGSVGFGTNAFVLSRDGSVRPFLAVAVMFAADMNADTIIVRDWTVAPEEQARLRALLAAVRLGVEFAL